MTGTPPLDDILAEVGLERRDGDPVFETPWQARSFGLAVAVVRESDRFSWEDFQTRLAEEVEAEPDPSAGSDVEGAYYRQWLAAFERLLVEEGILDDDSIDERAGSFARGDRTAEEFVEGQREH